MMLFVESSLMLYQSLVEESDARPSIGSQINTIEHLQQLALKLFKDIRDLELNVRILLYSEQFSDVNTEWLNDREALIKIYQRCENAIKFSGAKAMNITTGEIQRYILKRLGESMENGTNELPRSRAARYRETARNL